MRFRTNSNRSNRNGHDNGQEFSYWKSTAIQSNLILFHPIDILGYVVRINKPNEYYSMIAVSIITV